MQNTTIGTEVTLSAVVIRKDGTIEDLGEIYNSNDESKDEQEADEK